LNKSSALAWDGPTRLFKWTLVLVVFDGWLSNKYGASVPAWHKYNGYSALVLIVFRLLWGFAGGSTARFSNFVVGPRRLLSYLRGGAKYLGHNPLGGLMVIALLLLVAAQATTGLFAADDDRLIIEGPLAKTVPDSAIDFAARWHGRIFDVLEIAIVLHIAANIIYALFRREPLVRAMVTGSKPASDYADMASAIPGSWRKAAACLAIAAALVFGTLYAAGGAPL
jgi:cytochrome b